MNAIATDNPFVASSSSIAKDSFGASGEPMPMGASRLELSIALAENERTRPLLEGRVEAEGIRLIPSRVHPSEMFWRQLRYADFDISEMSLSSLIIAVSRGETRWAALPVYTFRKFYHTAILVRAAAAIRTPADLRGKRVGVPEYQQTSVIWCRGILQHEFGVRAEEIEWFMERGSDKSHGTSTGFSPPPGVRLNRIPPGTNIGEMMVGGELDAVFHYLKERNLVDRSTIDLATDPRVTTLFEDPAAEALRYYNKTGIYPINHCVVVRRALLERHPWIVLNLYAAFLAAKAEARRRMQDSLQHYLAAGLLTQDVRSALEADPMAYGLKATRPVIETLAQYVHEQGLSERSVRIEELFAPSTLEL
jgi:4,5-dihydroxyphthalate decarboxylase